MVLNYAMEIVNGNYKYFNWKNKLSILLNIVDGLEEIHQKNIVHYMGLCGEVGNIDKTKFYGVMPYVAPEVLRGKDYTQAVDIYSFDMIMYFVASKLHFVIDNIDNKMMIKLTLTTTLFKDT
ncbi:kinase-like domain-containing protein [Rhizophagus irregularis DAOM 181602=DAOM 197198]|uniref:Kinase-like domain-containing protein n=1 Tax=Rhizophagus irregularis (strain DAOM 181602 / DAOM 197198 / MUCL 43194) TaxID=747089 RepID=A0A2P4P993_RHIID|nr:kinase-like domain-containing protein [Rhizophagus irregularis DAOM 181602=DAOM 197198]POG61958.1 kinase-like domain-containing protein [Rhizophagus irregularis DAOM 181602=DAOM 197198]GET57413.1 kinase-like domain-containing protein [Rhizophagus irregularis DAOM 181602=DAOM 197198]|eukprot:XP_025168824.1 kinase-like domain-containing protein [Rhizophagus irregularis DAOM 181602=DAOM 197198]